MEIAISDDLLEPALDAIMRTADTGKVGDGKLFVFELLQAVRIRTRESGDDAL